MSKVASVSTERITNEGLALLLGATSGVDFVAPGPTLARGTQPLPALVEALSAKSALLALASDATVPAVEAALSTDRMLLSHLQSALASAAQFAIIARAPVDDDEALDFAGEIAARMPGLAFAERLSQGDISLSLAELKVKFAEATEDLGYAAHAWLEQLAADRYIGILEAGASARYAFSLLGSTETERKRVITEDPEGRNVVGRFVKADVTTKVDVFAVDRVHTVAFLKLHPLNRYLGAMPKRITALISALSDDLTPHLTVARGIVTHEHAAKRYVSGRVETRNKVVWEPDPALVLFGRYVLAGWGGSFKEPSESFHRGHRLEALKDNTFGVTLANMGQFAADLGLVR
jgi:hypothetical protein